jgi:hypothetical protein
MVREAVKRCIVSPGQCLLTHQKFADLHSEVLKYPTFSPDLAPSD